MDELLPAYALDRHREGLLLWVIHANKIPPHIGLSYNNEFYSLKANGVDRGVDVKSLEAVIDDKQIQTLIYVLNRTTIDLDDAFSKFEKTIPGQITCLEPIKLALGYDNADKIHHLLSELKENNEVQACIGLNVPKNFEGIPMYDISDIHSRLRLISNE